MTCNTNNIGKEISLKYEIILNMHGTNSAIPYILIQKEVPVNSLVLTPRGGMLKIQE